MSIQIVEISGRQDPIADDGIVVVGDTRRYLGVAEILRRGRAQPDKVRQPAIGRRSFPVGRARRFLNLLVDVTVQYFSKLRIADQFRTELIDLFFNSAATRSLS